MLLTLSLATLLVVLATMLPLLPHRHWAIRAMDFPRLQIAHIAAALLLAHLLLLDAQMNATWLLVCVTALCLLWQLWWILPYSVVWPKEVKNASSTNSARQLSVMTSNVLQTNRNSDALVALVREYQPDILVTLESDEWWEKQLEVLEDDMPYCVKCPLDNFYGMHLFSKLPFSEQEVVHLVEANVPSIHACLQLRSGDKVRAHFVHPAPPSPTENTESTERDAELISVARIIAETDQPIVVAGDLNDVAWSRTTRRFRKISGLLDPRVGRGIFNTFHADYPFLRWPLDHLFHSSHFTLQSIRRLPSIGSDHFALFTALMFTPATSGNQEGLEADAADYEAAEKTSRAMNTSKDDVPQPS